MGNGLLSLDMMEVFIPFVTYSFCCQSVVALFPLQALLSEIDAMVMVIPAEARILSTLSYSSCI
jgi:hypothetical protein